MRARLRFLSLLLLAWPAATLAEADSAGAARAEANADSESSSKRAWTVRLDNDLFALGERDRDYTAGVALTFADARPAAQPSLPARALDWLDARTRVASLHAGGSNDMRVLEAGLLLFSPQDLSTAEPLFDDRPYANLAYLTSSRATHDAGSRVATQSSLTLGVLGLPVAEHLHRGVHALVGGDMPRGYDNQISDGGEPTFRYAFTQHRLLARGAFKGLPYSLRFGAGGSIGYLTEAAAELELRWGGADIPWWSGPTSASDYAGHPALPSIPSRSDDGDIAMLFDAGLTLRARYFNAFLQGQFRDSKVTYPSGELDHLLWEAWIGGVAVVRDRLTIAYTVRYQSGEIQRGEGARDFTWASIVFSHRFK